MRDRAESSRSAGYFGRSMNWQATDEIPSGWRSGGIVLLDMDPGFRRSWAAKDVLADCLTEAGIRRKDIAILKNPGALQKLRPNIVVALGPEAAEASISGGWSPKDIDNQRGYLFEGIHDLKVLPTVHPEKAAKSWTPWRILLSYDLQKAKANSHDGHLRRPEREVRIVRSRDDARHAIAELRADGSAACDIENYDNRQLACVGFSGRPSRAFVFPAEMLDECKELLEDPAYPLIFQNGQYDVYFLRAFCGTDTKGFDHDIMLQWHACYPELAGESQKIGGGKSGSKRTHKSLAFFSSLYTTDAWWKDYEFANDDERFILNGRDCCITLEVHQKQQPILNALGVEKIYRQEMRLLEACMRMLERGLHVDNNLRKQRLEELEERAAVDRTELNRLLTPIIEERAEDLRLFQQQEGVCTCCRHATKKQQRCWSCAGFSSAPSKKELLIRFNGDPKKTKEELEDQFLGVCGICLGEPRREWLEFNPASTEQKRLVLYDALKLPRRYKTTKNSKTGRKKQILSVDEDTLKDLLAAA